ncbi:hypothetical protein [Xanthocytophaga flava]|uniref:hypothetical protein n=1 Tax=Xanthocytophaga flava TaxID=3048013 RepID=UPI0028D412B5|nr:hypothetical protein [Xanthocytophaga flavus]MDJ1470394.1 hypothetical protein [Xanthocytophaga flavus]
MWSYLQKVFKTDKESTDRQNTKNRIQLWINQLTIPPMTLKGAVRRANRLNQKIDVEWFTGGDHRQCLVKVENVYDKDNWRAWKLEELIEDKLQLVGIGEYYRKGCGRIAISEDNHVVLCYSAHSYYYEYGTEQDIPIRSTIIEWIEIMDFFQLEQYLHRVSISYTLCMYRNDNGVIEYYKDNPLLNIHIIEGDKFLLPSPISTADFYFDILKEYLQKFEEDFKMTEVLVGSKVLESIYITAILEYGKIRLELQKSYIVIDSIIENKSIILVE